MRSKPSVVVGGVVRDRADTLPLYLKHLEQLEGDIAYLFLENNSTDDTLAILQNWAVRQTRPVKVKTRKDKEVKPKWDRMQSFKELHPTFRYLADLRNEWIGKANWLFKPAYVLSVDSDILVQPDTLQRLLDHKKDIVAALVDNHFELGLFFNALIKLTNPKNGIESYHHIRQESLDGLMRCDLTGACMLVSQAVYKAGVRWETHRVGEDAGFAINAQAKGFELYCDTDHRLPHLMGDHPRPCKVCEGLKKMGYSIGKEPVRAD